MLLPFGSIWAENVHASADVTGIRISMWLLPDEERMVAMNQWLTETKMQSQYLADAVRKLAARVR